MESVYSFSVKTIDGKDLKMDHYQGKTLLVVNVASECGYTPQYKGLEALYQKYKDKGLEILGFPCNQFGGQEPGEDKEIATFCERNFGVTFPLFSKIEVNGSDAHPLFVHLKKAKKGILGTESIKWNFTKFLVDKQGNVIERYGSTDKPEALEGDIEKVL
jgi:glutathione peroxidase